MTDGSEHPFPATLTLMDGDRCFCYFHGPDLMDPRTGDKLQLGDDGGEFGPFSDLLDESLRVVKSMDRAAWLGKLLESGKVIGKLVPEIGTVAAIEELLEGAHIDLQSILYPFFRNLIQQEGFDRRIGELVESVDLVVTAEYDEFLRDAKVPVKGIPAVDEGRKLLGLSRYFPAAHAHAETCQFGKVVEGIGHARSRMETPYRCQLIK